MWSLFARAHTSAANDDTMKLSPGGVERATSSRIIHCSAIACRSPGSYSFRRTLDAAILVDLDVAATPTPKPQQALLLFLTSSDLHSSLKIILSLTFFSATIHRLFPASRHT